MRIIFSIVILLTLAEGASAQPKYRFRSQNYIGVVEGSLGGAFQLQSINGFQHNNWFLGAGAGLDFYKFRTAPLFLSVSKFISPGLRSFYVSVDGGINVVWQENEKLNIYESRFPPGLYWAGSVGYKVGIKDRPDAFLMSIGYSAKRLKEKRETPLWCVDPPCAPANEEFNYGLNRLSLRLGWLF